MITREEWLNELTENMISWAEDKLGSREYAGWCLSFIEDSLEKSNIIEIFGGNSAKESALLYADGMHQGIPEKCGMTYDHFSEKELTYLGIERDLTYYAIHRWSDF